MIASPCRQICELRGGICVGCGRTLDEIARWVVMSEAERGGVWDRLGRSAPFMSLSDSIGHNSQAVGTFRQRSSVRSMDKQTLLQRIEDGSARVGVVGLGYVGLPFAVEAAKAGFSVLGIERQQSRVDQVNRAENYIGDVHDDELREVVESGRLRAVVGYESVPDLDVLIIAVPTPLTINLTPDLQYIRSVTEQIAPHLRKGHLVSLESTTYPGTTEEVMQPILEQSGLKAEQDFFLAHSPERVDPGNRKFNTKNTNKVVGGVGPESLEVATAFYAKTIDTVVPVSSAACAEMVKVFENTFRAVNIALVNEMLLLCDRMGLNVWEVLEAANTKPFGIMRFMPGPGVGGHCIPLDPHYLEWKAREFNFNTHFIALSGEINRRMPAFVRDKAMRILNERGIALSRSRILVLGVAYKKDIDDWRESPSVDVMHLLEERGAQVDYHDPHIPQFRYRDGVAESVPYTAESLKQYDLVIIATDHSAVDYELLVREAKAVLDTRNATRGVDATGAEVTLL